MSCNVAGFSHYEGCTVFEELKVGTPLCLVREDENVHDHDAIAIFYGDVHLGYVPARQNSQLAKLFDLGYGELFEVYVQSLDPTEYPEDQVRVGIFLKSNPTVNIH